VGAHDKDVAGVDSLVNSVPEVGHVVDGRFSDGVVPDPKAGNAVGRLVEKLFCADITVHDDASAVKSTVFKIVVNTVHEFIETVRRSKDSSVGKQIFGYWVQQIFLAGIGYQQCRQRQEHNQI